MLRLRLFRVLLPVVLVGVVVLLIWAIRAPPDHEIDRNPGPELEREVTSAEIRVYGGLGPGEELRETLRFVAENVLECPDVSEDCLRAIGVREFKLGREGQEDLVISAATTEVVGAEGQRKMRFSGPVRIVDHELGLVLDLPHLDVDEFAGVARSHGAIHIQGAGHRTRAERLTYGLAGQATELYRLEMEDDEGGLLLAARAFLHDGVHDIELVQGVLFRRAEEDQRIRAERCRVLRDEESGRTRSIVAQGNVVAGYLRDDGFLEAAGDRLEARWDEAGELDQLTLDGRALLEHGPQFVSADRLEFSALEDQRGWTVDAHGSVHLAGTIEQGNGRLRADQLSAVTDASHQLVSAEASGSVRFESPGTAADADTARVWRRDETPGELAVELLAGPDLRARLAQDRSRVTADRIFTDTRGETLTATGRVESTLLPQGKDGALEGLFRTDKAVHFISDELRGGQGGKELVFAGDVRGWQGDQNLSAQRVQLDSERGTLRATDRVSTRFPRSRSGEPAASTDDFVQVTAETLDYDRDSLRTVYRESVRIVVAEGWIESESLTVTQEAEDGEFERLLAEGDVRLEFRESEGGNGGPLPRTTGHADRLVYIPAQQTVWLYGDEQRAEIQRGGDRAGTSRGRVLTYRLDDGTLSVEGGTVTAPAPPATVQQREPDREKSK